MSPHATNADVDYKGSSIAMTHDPAEDEEEYPMLPLHWERFNSFIEDALKVDPNAKILVHCHAGLNRSGVLAAAHLMTNEKIPVIDAVKRLRRVRGNLALCNEGFQRQLIELAHSKELLGESPDINPAAYMMSDKYKMKKKLVKPIRAFDKLTS
ncbi:hypothetical protein TrRE_jg10107 [Triparma retinervis]|uniref:protein-serine/threonine phosphatase n=1 Tax=Triparma retinervis TaxID=2557542 RepID=A0A9W7F949_9STRA|nr:hypothetical protein TrRE_jg10107 [Triparma retinervis]